MFSQKAAKVVIITYKGEHERAVLTVLRVTQNGMREGCDKNGTMTDPTFSGSVRAPSGSLCCCCINYFEYPGTRYGVICCSYP